MSTQTVTIQQLAQFADNVYINGAGIPSGWTTFLPYSYVAKDGFFAQSWINTNTHEIVVAIRGTVPSVFATLEQDAYIAVGKLAPGASDAANYALQVANLASKNPSYSGFTLAVTGHSLGGYEAQNALVRLVKNGEYSSFNPYSVVFDAPGLPSSALSGAKPTTFNSINFYAQGDAIHAAGINAVQIGMILPVSLSNTGPSIVSEFSQAAAAFRLGLLGGLGTALAASAATLLYNWALPAHSMDTILGSLGGPNGTNPGGSNSSIGNETEAAYLSGNGATTPNSNLSAAANGAIVINDGSGSTLTAQPPTSVGAISASAVPGSDGGLVPAADEAALQTQITADGSQPAASQTRAAGLLNSLEAASHIDITESQTSAGLIYVTIGTVALGGATDFPGQLTVANNSNNGRFEFGVPAAGQTAAETIIGENAQNSLWVNNGQTYSQLKGGSASSVTPKTWVDANGTQYTFADTGGDFGTLMITDGLLGTTVGNSITIDNFNLASAQDMSTGYMGIILPETLYLNASANTGVDPPAPNFVEGTSQAYTVSVDVPNTTLQMITVTLVGALPSDFEAVQGDTIEQLNSNGTFSVALAAGQTSAAFTLTDLTADDGSSDIAKGGNLQISASLLNPDTLVGGTIQTTPLTFNYIPQPFSSSPSDTINGTLSGGTVTVTSYQGDQANDFVSAASGYTNISLLQSANDTVIGNGSTSVIVTGDGNSQIFAGSQTNLANAIAIASTGVGTGQQGDLIAVGHGNNTIVGSNGNDFIATNNVNPNGTGGNDVVVLGGGEDTYAGGVAVTGAAYNWSVTSTTSSNAFIFLPINVQQNENVYINPFPQPYNGIVNAVGTNIPFGASNATIYGGTGNYLIALGNGNNYVNVGSGNSTVGGGMGNDTIIAGTGADDILAGGGTNYVAGGSGTDIIYGGDGSNTIIGGSGNATIFSGTYEQEEIPFANQNLVSNYVTGGSGNDLIFGSGSADTLIGGTGNVTIVGGSGNENITGGSGNDNLTGGTGNSTVDAGGAGADTLSAGGSATSTSVVYGGAGSDSIIGGSGVDTLYAGDGGTAGAATTVFASQSDATAATTIYGGLGVDLLEGGAGTAVIFAGDGGTSSAPTTVIGSTGATTLYGGLGTDILQAGSGNALVYAGDGGTAAAPTTVLGGAGVDTLNGGAGPSLIQDTVSGQDLLLSNTANDTLIGIGNDTLVAGSGNDLLQTNSGITNFEFNAGFGNDTIVGNGGTVNLLLGTGLSATDFSGSVSFDGQLNNYLTLSGDGGSITIKNALTGNLVSAAYADPTPIPLLTLLTDVFGGDQTIASGNNASLILALSNNEATTTLENNDTLSSYGNGASLNGGYYFGAHIYSTGSAAVIASGFGYDSINAMGANATVTGGQYQGNITVAGANSIVISTSGYDTLTASGSNDTLTAVSGHSQFNVNSASTTIQVNGGTIADVVIATVSYTAPNNVNTLTLAGTANIAGTGNFGADQLTGGAGIDTLTAGIGLATLIGGSGNTTFSINNVGDVVQSASATGNNVLLSSVNYSLPTNVNALLLTGTAALLGTANNANDTLTSNSGVDTLVGGLGNDTFVLNNPGDVVVDTAGTATYIYSAAANYTLPASATYLQISGTAAISATGNGGADTLISNSGMDTLVGGAGNDTFIVNNVLDVVQDTASSATNVLEASVTYSLPTNVNSLTLLGSGALSATGNTAANVIVANSGNDTLVAGTGIATLIGGIGNETFAVNNLSDVIQDTSSTATNTLLSSISITLPTNVNSLVLTGSAGLVGTANAVNDTMVSNTGLDTLIGGVGNESFVVNNSGDVLQDSITGATNVALSNVNFSLPTNVNMLTLMGTSALMATANNSGNDVITANSGVDTLVGGGASDTLVSGVSQPDSLVGGTGNTLFIINNSGDMISVGGSNGDDSIQSSFSTTLPSSINTLRLTGSANLTGTAISGNNLIIGNSGNDILTAGSGFDDLIAGSGIDTLVGGTGSDAFVIDNTADVVQSLSNTDNQITSSVSYTLPTNATTLVLTGSANLQAAGNSQTNYLTANSGNDTLIAGSGVTTFETGVGSDLFIVNNSNDIVYGRPNNAKFGVDTIESSVSFTASAAGTLAFIGSANLTGSESDGIAALLIANAGNDTLTAGTGNDTLEAGSGFSTLIGGSSNDTFIVNNASDVVQDTLSGYSNILLSSVNATLLTNINTLQLTGSGSLSATGNSANDSLVGNSGADTLVAGTGADTLVSGSGVATLIGGAGSDTFVVNNASDSVLNASSTGQNAVRSSVNVVLPTNVNLLTLIGLGNVVGTGNSGLDTLVGGAGTDTLIAGTGLATLIGGLGNTTFVVNSTGDVVSDNSTSSSNTVLSSVNYSLVTNVNALTLTGSTALKGTANNGNDTLVSNTAVDTLVGGAGNDTFVVNNSSDSVQDNFASATNVAQSSVTFALPVDVNTLLLTGAAALEATANSGADTLISNSGVDTLIGGSGNDTFVVNNALDVVQDSFASTNAVFAEVSYTLPMNVNQLTAIGSLSLTATGNTAADVIIANSGNDTLIAGAGIATLIGGLGSDSFVINNSNDVVEDSIASTSNFLVSSVGTTLATNVNTLTLSGSAALVGTANGGNDTLISNSGVDTLVGGSGTDLFVVNNPADVIINGSASDTIEAGTNYSLPSSISHLLLTGTASVIGTDNGSNDVITANSGADTLVAGNDGSTLIGGVGNDVFVITGYSGYNDIDVVQETAVGTNSLVVSSVSFSLPTNIDALTLTGSGSITGTGNGDASNVLTSNATTAVLIGTAFSNTLIGGAGAATIDVGPYQNVAYAGASGGTVYGNATGTSSVTQSTIYGGAGGGVIDGGPGTDLLIGAAGPGSIMAGTGFDTLMGAAGNSLTDNLSGADLLVGGAGSESLTGDGADTLQAGTGNESIVAGLGYEGNDIVGNQTLVFGPTVGQDTVSGGTVNILFTGTPGSITATESKGVYSPNLVLNDGTGFIQIGGGLQPGVINSVQFAGSSAMTLQQFLNQYGPGTVDVSDGSFQSLLSTNSGQNVVPGVNDGVAYTYGNNDTVAGLQSYAGPVYVYGNSSTINAGTSFDVGNDELITGGRSTITGANDTVASSTYEDGTFLVEQPSTVFNAAVGSQDSITSYVSFTLPTNVAQLTLASGYPGLLGASNTLGGTLIAVGNYDTLTGGAGSDTLVAAGNADVLVSGTGRETFVLDNPTSATIVLGTGTASLNTVQTAYSYTLTGAANSLDETGNYTSGTGNSGNDSLTATGYNDTLVAGAGNDIFNVNNSSDVILDSFPIASDVVDSSVNYSLPTNVNILVAGGVGGVTETANSGNDSLVATTGNDTLVAGVGADTLVAGSGPDTFVLNSGFGHDQLLNVGNADVIQFGAGISQSNLTFTALLGSSGVAPSFVISGYGGSLTVPGGLAANAISAVDFTGGGSYTVPQLLAPTGRSTITGPNGNLIISTLNGDSVTGGSGQDTIYAYGNNDSLSAGAGGSVISAGGASDTVKGSAATDNITAIGASDTLIAGSGHESFTVNNTSTVVVVAPGMLTDTVQSSVNFTVPANVTIMTMLGSSALVATGNSNNDVITGNAGFDTLIAGSATDTLIGESTADTYVVNNSADVVQGATGATGDLIFSTAASFTLPANINLLFVGPGDSGAGNSLNDSIQGDYESTLIAGSGNDTLASYSQGQDFFQGGSGQDLMIAGGANNTLVSGAGQDTLEGPVVPEYGVADTFIINNSADDLIEVNQNDTLETSVNYTLAVPIYSISGYLPWTLIGTGGITATSDIAAPVEFFADSPNDTMVGGPGSNQFIAAYGTSQPETYIGGPTTNQFTVQSAADVISAPAGSQDTVTSYLPYYSLPPNFNSLALVYPGDVGVGNSGNDTLFGDGGSDTLIAGSGNDSLSSFYGHDTLVAGTGNDTLSEGYGGGFPPSNNTSVFVVNSGFGTLLINAASPTPGTLVEFGAGVTASNFSVTAALDPLGNTALKLTDGASTVTLDGVLNGNGYEFQFSNGSPETLSQFLSQAMVTSSSVTGANGNVIFDGTATTSIRAGGGNDTIYAGATYDTLAAGAGSANLNALGNFDSVVGGSVSSVLNAGGAHDTLVSGSSYDTLIGTLGSSTTYVITSTGGGANVQGQFTDTIDSATTYESPENVGTLVLTGTQAIVGTVSDNCTLVSSNMGVDTLYGTATANHIYFVVNNAQDSVYTNPSAVGDTLSTSLSFTLPSYVNDLLLTGTMALRGTANSVADTLVSNAGADTLVGNNSSDTFVVNNSTDVIQDTSTSATNIAQSSVNYTLPINVNRLVMTGSGNLVATGNSANDSLVGGSGQDTLAAGSGVDTLVAGSGLTTLIGGSGNDTFVVNNSGDMIQDTVASAANVAQSSVSYSLVSNVNSLTLTGTAALIGTANGGNDVLTSNSGLDTLVGGSGNDTFVINNANVVVLDNFASSVNVAKSAVSYSLALNVNNLIITGSAAVTGTANSGNDSLTGSTGLDTLVGGAGIDTLVAGSALNTLLGGSGNTTFVVNNVGDVIQDSSATAVNTVRSSVTYVLPTGINALVLTGSVALKGTANSGNDTLTSNAAIDTLVGGSGNDIFVVGNASDVVQDTSGSANNVIQSSISFTLPTDVNTLTLTGSAAVLGVGNAASDLLSANSGADTLVAGNGNDTLASSASGSAIDSLVGGAGADLFLVNYSGDIVNVGGTHGVDTIQSSASYTNAVNVAVLALTGTANLAGTGTTTADTLIGNLGTDTLTAGSGLTTLLGGAGNETFVVNNTGDVVQDTSATSSNVLSSSVSYVLPTNVNRLTLTGTLALQGTANNGNDTLSANSGTDTLVSGTGTAVDSLVGGAGANLFVVNNASDIVTVGSSHGVDTIQSSVSYSAATNVANLTLTGTAALAGVGNSLAGILTANSGADTLTAGTGADTLVGSTTGTDTFVVNSASDIVSEATSGTSDTIQSSATTYTLPTNVQYLVLTGSAALSGTGNSGTGLVIGNTGNDTLTGGTGIAALEGGRTAGSDQIKAASNQAALIAGGGSSTLTGGAYKDFYAAGKISDSLTTGATANVVSVNKGDGATTLQPTSGATNVLSLGAGIDTESLYFTKTGNNLILTDGVSGDSITFANWYVGTADQSYTKLQVVEIASANYNSSGSDALRNKPLEEFNFTSLVAAYNTAKSPANWALSTAMPSATLASSTTADYGGDLAYYFGLNGNLTGVNLSDVQATLTNVSYGTATQTISAYSSISGGSGLQLAVSQPSTTVRQPIVSPQPPTMTEGTDPVTASPSASSLASVDTTAPNKSTVEVRPPETLASPHIPQPREVEATTTTPAVCTGYRGRQQRPGSGEAATVSAAAMVAALAEGDDAPQNRSPERGFDARRYVDPINLRWITLHSALDHTTDIAFGGAESSALHETMTGDALLGSDVRSNRTKRLTDSELHPANTREHAL